jgi:hypothetical protein
MSNIILYYSLILYTILIILLFVFKPSIIYNHTTNNYVEYYLSNNHKIYTFYILGIFGSFFIYFVVNILFKKKLSSDVVKSQIYNAHLSKDLHNIPFFYHPYILHPYNVYNNI